MVTRTVEPRSKPLRKGIRGTETNVVPRILILASRIP